MTAYTRTRSRGSFVYDPIVHTTTYCNGSKGLSAVDSNLHYNGTVETMSDVVTPGFKRLQAEGGVVMTKMEKTLEKRVSSQGFCSRTYIPSCSGTTVRMVEYTSLLDFMMGLPDYKSISYGDLETEVYTKMSSQIDQPDALTLVDFFEAKKTISSLVDIVRQFRGILVRIAKSQEMKEWMRKRGIPSRYPSPGETFQFISENWLRYRYMILPIFLSGQGVLKAYKSTPRPKGSRETYRASGSITDHDTITGAYVTSSSWKSRVVADRTVTVHVRCGALTEVVRAKCLETSLGLDAQSLPRSIWEAIPWSFVWDWFFNIGDFIAAVSPHVGRKTLGSWTTTTITSEITWRTENSHSFSGSVWNVSLSNSSGYRSKTWTYRDAGGNVGLVGRPFKGRFTDLIHLYDAIALLSQRFR